MNNTNNQLKKKRAVGVPKFLRHLYSILCNEDSSIIAWSADGMSIRLFDVKRLEQDVLPKYFKHNKLASFQRQLNYFGFRKWTKTQSCVCTFSHTQLNKHSTPDTMNIPRKHPTTFDAADSSDTFSDDLCDVLLSPVSDTLLDDILNAEVSLKFEDWDLMIEPFQVDSNFDWLDAAVCV